MESDRGALRGQIEAALDTIRPALQADGGDVEFVDIDSDGVVSVQLVGACGGCPMSQMTLTMGVERALREQVPGVKRVVSVGGGGHDLEW
jgi:Fe-S cluster biogenesis protein NfuA